MVHCWRSGVYFSCFFWKVVLRHLSWQLWAWCSKGVQGGVHVWRILQWGACLRESIKAMTWRIVFGALVWKVPLVDCMYWSIMWVRALLSISMWRHFYNEVLARDHVDTMIHEDGRETFWPWYMFQTIAHALHWAKLDVLCNTRSRDKGLSH